MDSNEALHRVHQAARAYDRNPHDSFARQRAAQDLRDAFAELDRLLVRGAPVPANWADPDTDRADATWQVVFRNRAGHTVATSYVAARGKRWLRGRVKADLGIYFSWRVKDAVIRSIGHNAAIPLIVPNPAHERMVTELGRSGQDMAGEGDG